MPASFEGNHKVHGDRGDNACDSFDLHRDWKKRLSVIGASNSKKGHKGRFHWTRGKWTSNYKSWHGAPGARGRTRVQSLLYQFGSDPGAWLFTCRPIIKVSLIKRPGLNPLTHEITAFTTSTQMQFLCFRAAITQPCDIHATCDMSQRFHAR